ncbi:hypothetical protein KZP23_20590 [Echinicola marina]|uniref:ArnT family glycosyltransferase n=1 Tax=Echinicola marina TaxID=2859768 RepID=UPI001CF61F07|nr:hypothetical protein [Echinicola marina]UCS93030.1 hypothetical protein KZP23_20590 [Echinicola marina]
MEKSVKLHQPNAYLITGILLLIGYWFFAYDGITFSDDVAYIKYGQNFWLGKDVLTGEHFTFRWGAYILSGFFTFLFGFNDRIASLSSLVYYIGALCLLWTVMPKASSKFWLVLFFIPNIYLLHFLPKVYPDSPLIFWTALIPYAANARFKRPLESGLLMALAFFVGFCTKETIIYLAPFPAMLLVFDYIRDNSKIFYIYFFSFITLMGILYLGYFEWKYDDALFRFRSIQEGHYVSAYSYFDKGWLEMLERLTFVPITTFVERTYWIWIVLSIPSIIRAFLTQRDLPMIFSLCTISMILGFWLMSTSFSYYNPIHLNPRHLIILIPLLSANIALENYRWMDNFFWNKFCSIWIAFGGFIALSLMEWNIAIYYFLFAACLGLLNPKFRLVGMVFLMILPVFIAVKNQTDLKNYPHFKNAFIQNLNNSDRNSPLLTHQFICDSQEVILENLSPVRRAISLEEFKDYPNLDPPQNFTLFIYKYSQHAYPKHASLLQNVREFAEKNNYLQTESREDQWLKIIRFEKINPLSPQPKGEFALNIE